MHTHCLVDKYTSVIYLADETNTIERFEMQPLPDCIRWVNTSEPNYLSQADSEESQQEFTPVADRLNSIKAAMQPTEYLGTEG